MGRDADDEADFSKLKQEIYEKDEKGGRQFGKRKEMKRTFNAEDEKRFINSV